MRRNRTPEYDILREMFPARKLDVMHALIRQAYDLKSAAILASEPDLIALFIRPLEASGMKYMVTGGGASVIYGDPLLYARYRHRALADGLRRRAILIAVFRYFRESGSDRHLRDVAMMLEISDEIIDHEELRSWIAPWELQDAFNAAVAYEE